MSARYPLDLLPKEIWETIILEVKDSEDLRSLMKASKQLNDIFIKIHHLWLLDKVLPILVPNTRPKPKHYLELKDLKNLRLVDKRWSRGVNAFLENQPKLRPYDKSDDKVNSEDHIWPELCVGDNLQKLETGRVTLSSHFKISEFSRTFGNWKGNPFLSRSIIGNTKPSYLFADDTYFEFWQELEKEVFERHGKHVWFIRMKWEGDYHFRENWRPNAMWEGVVKSLSSLPNLKGLHLDCEFESIDKCYMSESQRKEFLQAKKSQLPHMEFLESLRITPTHALPQWFSMELVSKYCGQLRRLQISILLLESREKWTFPNLTQLRIDKIIVIEKVTQFLTFLEAPKLTRLQLKTLKGRSSNPLKISVFPWINLFPSLLHLNMPCTGLYIRESITHEIPKDFRLPLKYLKIGKANGVNYNFLRYFPNIQRLQICLNTDMVISKDFCKLHVWELCARLRSLLVTDHFSRHNYREFYRETYEKMEKGRDSGETSM